MLEAGLEVIIHMLNQFANNPGLYIQDVELYGFMGLEEVGFTEAVLESLQKNDLQENIQAEIESLQNELKCYIQLDSERKKEREVCETLYAEYCRNKEWENEIEDRDRDLRTREYKKEYGCSQEKLFEIVCSLCEKYTQTEGSNVTIGWDKSYYFLNQTPTLYFVVHSESDPRLGHDMLRVEKLYTFDANEIFFEPSTYEFAPELADGAAFYAEIGYITISKTLDDNVSTISIKTENADLLDFFKTLLSQITFAQNSTKNVSRKSSRHGPNPATIDKINNFAEYRQSSINERRNVPGWINSCQSIGIDFRIVREHAPQLADQWNDIDFRWGGFEETDL